MSDQLEWRERLEGAHKQMQDAMPEMITKKDYSEAQRLLHARKNSLTAYQGRAWEYHPLQIE